MSLQITTENELGILRNQEVKYITKIMKMIMGFLVLPCIFPNAKKTNQDLEVVCRRSPISAAHVQCFHNKMDSCSWHNPCC
jgi:hypothetical protein